ncbi:MAG: LysM peptidoglycan-binding domain-containing protein [Planctomycetota bacterium]
MTRETKIGLLIGLAIIVLVAVIVSDYVAVQHRAEPADPLIDSTVTAARPIPGPAPAPRETVTPRPSAERQQLIPTPEEIDRALAESREAQRLARERAAAEIAPPEEREPTPLELATAQRSTERLLPPRLFSPDPRPIPTPEAIEAIDETAPTRDRSDKAAEPVAEIEPTPQRPTLVHRVETGDTLYAIAERYLGDGDAWPRIARHNPEVVPADGGVIEGTRLLIPHRNAPDQPASIDLGRVDAPRTVTVQAGDTLGRLAARHLGSADRWRDLLEANRGTIDSPDTIRVGQRLVLPSLDATPAPAENRPDARRANPTQAFSGRRTYTVEEGDTLFTIARDTLGNGERWPDLFDANRHKLDSPDTVRPGQTLTLPQ